MLQGATQLVRRSLGRFRRRWLYGALLIVGCCALAAARIGPSRRAVVERLQPYLDRDLRDLSEDEQIEFDNLVGHLAASAKVFHYPDPPQTRDAGDWLAYLRAKPSAPLSRSWYLWRVVDGQGRPRLVLFQGTPLWFIPGSSSARIFVFDARGHLLTECAFPTGWRITIAGARWLEDSGHGFPCLLVVSVPNFGGADVVAQYYAFLDETFALVRMVDSTGNVVPVNYHSPNHTIGPAVPERTAEQWEAAVRSSDRAEVLRTLVWLGGGHSDPPLRTWKEYGVERFEDASRALEARARPEVRSAVEALTRSEDHWVWEAAREASDVMQRSRDR
jgi:hypothetical protein